MIGALRKDSGLHSARGKPVALKLADDHAAGLIEGYGAVFANLDRGGDVIAKGAFQATLAEHKAQGTLPAMLWSHNPDKPIGTWTDVREDAKGLVVRGQLNLDTQGGREALALLKGRAVNGLSIGYVPKRSERDPKTGSRTLKEVELWEISLVTFPMNPQARITRAKSATAGIRKLEDVLREDLGLSRTEAKRFIHHGWSALDGRYTKATRTRNLFDTLNRAIDDLKGMK
jgi:HK97 family phage prohead protease